MVLPLIMDIFFLPMYSFFKLLSSFQSIIIKFNIINDLAVIRESYCATN